MKESNKGFVELTSDELMDVNGGVVVETAAVVAIIKGVAWGAAAIGGAGVFVGYTNSKR